MLYNHKMAPKGGKGKKRTAPADQASSIIPSFPIGWTLKTHLSIYQAAATKKRKLAQADGAPRKEKFADRGFIPVPVHDDDDEVELSDEDVGMLEEFGGSMGFLTKLDKKGIMRCVCSGISRAIVPQFMQE